MNNQITFRFYPVSKEKSVPHTLSSVMSAIGKVTPKVKRERQIAGGALLRLEEFETETDGSIVGELIRVQSTNMPADVTDDGRQALAVKRGLAHGVIFRYDEPAKVLTVQHAPQIASVGRIMDYIAAYQTGAVFVAAPMVKKDSWARFNSGGVRKLTVRVARPAELQADASQSCFTGMRLMGTQYDAPSVKVEISMGHYKGTLGDSVRSLASQAVNLFGGGDGAELRSLSAKVEGEDGDVDLISERLKVTEDLNLDPTDPHKNYERKRSFIRQIMKDKKGEYA